MAGVQRDNISLTFSMLTLIRIDSITDVQSGERGSGGAVAKLTLDTAEFDRGCEFYIYNETAQNDCSSWTVVPANHGARDIRYARNPSSDDQLMLRGRTLGNHGNTTNITGVIDFN